MSAGTTVELTYPTINQIAGSMAHSAPEFQRVLMTICPAGDLIGRLPVVTCNQGTVHHITRPKTLGDDAVARTVNQGVPANMSEDETVTEDTMSLETRYPIDKKILEKNKNSPAFIESRNKKAVLKLRMDLNNRIMYDNKALPGNNGGINGIATRYGALQKEININTGRDQVWDFGGTGNNLTSIYLIAPGVDTVSLLAPDTRDPAGLSIKQYTDDNGTFLRDRVGNPFRGMQTWYEWNIGLAVHNPHAIMRLANVPANALTDLVKNGITSPQDSAILRTMIEMTGYVSEDVDRSSWCFWMSRSQFTAMKILMFDKTNGYWTPPDMEGHKYGRVIGDFLGTPVYASDYILDTEEQVVASPVPYPPN